MQTANDRWIALMGEWAIPQHILDAVPESPWGFPPELFRPPKDKPMTAYDSPSRRRALEALPEGGSVIDVGVGAGAASLPLVPRAGLIVGVDEGADMLEVFAEEAEAAGVAHREVLGTWPDIAAEVEVQDVVVCNHVTYNVKDLAAFAAALADHARERVVVEMSGVHPLRWANHLWRHFHDLERPEGPDADDAIEVFRELGLDVNVERWIRPPRERRATRAQFVSFLRRRLCLPVNREAELDAVLGEDPRGFPVEVATIWWPGTA